MLGAGAVLDNAGTVGGSSATAVEGALDGDGVRIVNHDGGTISSSGVAVLLHTWSQLGIKNVSGGHIEGGKFAVELDDGGLVKNDGAGSSIRSQNGVAIQVSGDSGDVENTGGATISSGSTAIFLGRGGHVNNGVGSTIVSTGGAAGDCGTVGVCAIYVPSDTQDPVNPDGSLTMINDGAIVGSVQMAPTAYNTVALSTGSSIEGDLDIGSNHMSSLSLAADVDTVQLYSRAVTGKTTFAGGLYKGGLGTWIIDNDDLAPVGTNINGGTLQIGNGGTTGWIGSADVQMMQGSLVFDRSDDVVFNGNIQGVSIGPATLVQAGTGKLTLHLLLGRRIELTEMLVQHGTLEFDNTGDFTCGVSCPYEVDVPMANDGSLVFDGNAVTTYGGVISGSGSVTKTGSGQLVLAASNTYLGGTTVNGGQLRTMATLPGDVLINAGGTLDGSAPSIPTPIVAGNLSNAGRVLVSGGDSSVGGNYTQASTGALAVNLGSKLDVAGTATLQGGALEITGVDYGYASNTRTEVLAATGGVNGSFDQLVKDAGVVFTSTTINYDANSVWLDTTGLDVTVAAAGAGVSYTPASRGSAIRVQGAFQQLDNKMAAGGLSGVSADFLRNAGQFQQAPDLQSAQASLRSLSGQLHATSAAMTLKAIDASSRALSDRFQNLLGQGIGVGTWMQNQRVGGDMTRTGFDGVDYQLNGWLVGNDRRVGSSGVAGFAFGQSQGGQWTNRGIDRDSTRSMESMLYAGWLRGNWYTDGRVGFGHFQQDVRRQLLLGYSSQAVSTRYNGRYGVAYGESGLYLDRGQTRFRPFASVEYARIGRDGFAEQGAGGFGLRTGAQVLDRWQGAVGMRASHRWDFNHGRAVDFSAHAQWQRTLASHGDVFDASFVGLQQWEPLAGIGLSRFGSLMGVDLIATLSPRATMEFSYDHESGQRDSAQTAFAHLNIAL
jgi:fibronectin-binding autotransporter adhesin